MDLQLLHATPHVSIHYDQANDWLFVDWQGHLDLPAVALASLELIRIFLQRPYRRMLISHALVTSISWDVPAWLAHEALPYFPLAGVEKLAWMSGRSARMQDAVQEITNRLPSLPIAMFDDLEMAVGWLQRATPAPHAASHVRPLAIEAKLRLAVRNLRRLVLGQQYLQVA
jgi:hypothetical protein